MTSDGPRELTDVLDSAAQQFVLWCLEAMQLSVTTDENDVHLIEIPVDSSAPDSPRPAPHPYSQLAGRRFSFAQPPAGSDVASAPVEHLTLQSPLTRLLFEQLQTEAAPVHATAAKQPGSVHELTTHLFTQYQVDNGHIHLAGCSLEERPFLRLSFLDAQASEDQPQVIHCYGTSDGELLDDALRKELELDELIPLASRARLDGDVLHRWTNVTRQQFEPQSNGRSLVPIATTLIWCKHAEGKLTFSIGRSSVEIPFAGWARLLVDRKVLPPPYTCPLTGQSSYHLAATDDGRITVADAIATCAQSGQRVLESELETCAETGLCVLPDYLQICPATGSRVLASALATCSLCQQPVSPQALDTDRCPACRSLVITPKTDPQMARILDAYPKLDRWRAWKMAENDAAHVLVGKSTWKRLLVVLDKQTLDILHVAIGSRFSSKWTAATDVQRTDWVG